MHRFELYQDGEQGGEGWGWGGVGLAGSRDERERQGRGEKAPPRLHYKEVGGGAGRAPRGVHTHVDGPAERVVFESSWVCAGGVWIGICGGQIPAFSVVDLRTEYLTRPLGIDVWSHTFRGYWSLQRGYQGSYRIHVPDCGSEAEESQG